MLTNQTFKSIVKNTPLVSIDICLVHNNKLLLGKRNNQPYKGGWFTPGGRILKNECWQDCLIRVAQCELGINIDDTKEYKLMGIWDHFYMNSAVDKNISTHYVNLPHFCYLKNKPILIKDSQHDELAWFDLKHININNNFHEYICNYASWLLAESINNND